VNASASARTHPEVAVAIHFSDVPQLDGLVLAVADEMPTITLQRQHDVSDGRSRKSPSPVNFGSKTRSTVR
jgi:hypothetical protein